MFCLGSDYDDIKRGQSIYISPNGIDGWTRMSPPNTRVGPKVMFTSVEERNAQIVRRHLFPFFARSSNYIAFIPTDWKQPHGRS